MPIIGAHLARCYDAPGRLSCGDTGVQWRFVGKASFVVIAERAALREGCLDDAQALRLIGTDGVERVMNAWRFWQGEALLRHVAVRTPGGAQEWVTDDEARILVGVSDPPDVLEVELDGQWWPARALVASDRLWSSDGPGARGLDWRVGAPEASPQVLPQVAPVQVPQPELALPGLDSRYELECEIGRGGMGVVYRARDRVLGRRVAIKALGQWMRGQAEAERLFLEEARSLAGLSHPNLVAIHDVVATADSLLLVTEYVPGCNLEDVLAERGALHVELALDAGVQLAAAVAYLHERGIIHRDIKPSNVILQDDGTVKLVDFGLARRLEDLLLRTTGVRGTPAYMAPEQFLGEPLGPSCDVYQLGVTLFELLTGRLPFEGPQAALAPLYRPAPSLAEFLPLAPKSLVSLVDSALAKDPEKRPANAAHFAQGLADLSGVALPSAIARATLPNSPRPAPVAESDERLEHLSPGEYRHGGMMRVVMALAVAIGLAALAVVFLSRRAEQPVARGVNAEGANAAGAKPAGAPLSGAFPGPGAAGAQVLEESPADQQKIGIAAGEVVGEGRADGQPGQVRRKRRADAGALTEGGAMPMPAKVGSLPPAPVGERAPLEQVLVPGGAGGDGAEDRSNPGPTLGGAERPNPAAGPVAAPLAEHWPPSPVDLPKGAPPAPAPPVPSTPPAPEASPPKPRDVPSKRPVVPRGF